MNESIMSPEDRAAAMQMLGGGLAARAGNALNPANRAAQMQAMEAGALGQPVTTRL